MQTHTDIINQWPSLSDYAGDIGVAYGTAQVMRYRGAISSDHWDNVVTAAEKRGLSGITHALLARTAPKRASRRRQERAA